MWHAFTKMLSATPSLRSIGGAGVPLLSSVSLTNCLLMLFSKSGMQYVGEQYLFMLNCFGLLFLALLISLVTAVVKKRRIHVEAGDALSLSIIQVIVQGFSLLYLGRADGAYLSYFLQLWMPYVIVAALICVSRYIRFSKEFLNLGLIAALSFLSIYLGYHKLPLYMMSEDDIANWQQAKAYVETYEQKEDKTEHVYYVPELAFLAMEQGKRSYNNGHATIRELLMDAWTSDKYAQRVFPEAGKIIEWHIAYQEKTITAIRNRQYSLIAIDEEHAFFFVDKDLLTQSGYKRIDTLPLACGNAHYDVEFWIPEEK